MSGSAYDPALLSFSHKLSSSTEWILSENKHLVGMPGLPVQFSDYRFDSLFSPLPGLHILMDGRDQVNPLFFVGTVVDSECHVAL